MDKKRIALFDFDGTITVKDSLLCFIRYVVGDFRFIVGFVVLIPFLIAYKLKFFPNYKAKEKVLTYFFKGYTESIFKKAAHDFSSEQLEKIVRPEALNRLQWHKEQGHKVVVVSASLECWLDHWCRKNDLELLGTKLEVKNGVVTGKLQNRNCYGLEKVNRISQKYDLTEFEYIYAYGDSIGDKEMLELADAKYFRCLS